MLAGMLGAFAVAGAMATPLAGAGICAAIVLLFALFGSAMPRAYARIHPERVAVLLARFTALTSHLAGPLAALLDLLARNALGLRRSADQPTVHEELRETIDLHHKEETLVKTDKDMLGGILDLKDLEVMDVMVHRTKMVTLDVGEPVKDIVAQVLKSGHTRIPVWRDKPDNIIGVLHAKALFAAIQKAEGDAWQGRSWTTSFRTRGSCRTRAPLEDQLNAFLRRKSHFAIVVDEYGEVQGLITLEDIIEEIVGDIKDEFDAVATGVRKSKDGSIIVDGALPLRDLNRAFDWELPDDEATTLAGLVIHEARMIPSVGQTFSFHGFRFEILKKRKHQVTALRMTPLKREADGQAAG
jgi:Mg2+/Co2+ transporter CorB